MPDVLRASVIVPTRNRPDQLARTLGSLVRADPRPDEIIVIDQSDRPDASLLDVRELQGCRLAYVHSSEPGLSRARNRGAQLARTDVLVFVDDDMDAEAGWLSALVGALDRGPSETIATGRVLPASDAPPGTFVPALVTGAEAAVFTGLGPSDPLAGGNMAVRRGTFERLGGFEPELGPGSRYASGEDNELGYRFLRAGGRIVYVPEAVLYHRAWRPVRDYVRLRWCYGRGKGAFFVKHLPDTPGYMRRRLRSDTLGRAWRLRRQLLHPRYVAGELAYLAGVITGAIEWRWRSRRFPETEPVSRAARRG